ncbi:two-component sensor histidine kinase [Saccharopolyspora erythraea]|nr:two-component sensor histidine kinase [Saccharopolyspora erythraea]
MCLTFLTLVSPVSPTTTALLNASPVSEFAVTATIAVLSAAGVLLAPRWHWPLFAVAFAAVVVQSTSAALAVASYYAATTIRRPVGLAGYATAAAAAVVVPVAVRSLIAVPGGDGDAVTSALGGVVLVVVLPVVLGLWTNARKQVLAGLEERAEQLEREQAARAEQTRAKERARIAREMHDVVAHRVSLIVLHAGAIEVNTAEEGTAAEAGFIRETGREALSQLRGVLGVLRSPGADAALEPQPSLADLDRLLDKSRAAGIPVVRRDEGDTTALPAMVEHTAYRVVQEALTNVHKHAGEVRTDVVLRHGASTLEVTVHNAGPARRTVSLPSSGLGLVGLRERVGLLGGRFHAGTGLDGGFTVTAVLPLWEEQL